MVASGRNLVLRRVPDVDDMHVVATYREKNAVFLPTTAVEEFADFFGEFVVFGGEGAAAGMGFEGDDLLFQGVLPSRGGWGLMVGRGLDDDAVGHGL